MHLKEILAIIGCLFVLSVSGQVKDVFVFPDASVHIEGVAYNPEDATFYRAV